MASTVDLTELRAAVRQLSDNVNATAVTDAMVDRVINLAIKRLHGKVVQLSEDDFTTTTTIAVTSGAPTSDLPADFLKLRHVMWTPAGDSTPDEIHRVALQDATRWASGNWTRGGVRYRLVGRSAAHVERLRWWPTPNLTTVVTIFYVPAPTVLADPADTYDGRSGYEDWVTHHAASQLLIAEESDARMVLSERDRIWAEEIAPLLATRDENQPDRVRDVDRDDDWCEDWPR